MPRYIFSNGKVTVEDGVYTPLLPSDKHSRRRVVIFPASTNKAEVDESMQNKEQSGDQES